MSEASAVCSADTLLSESLTVILKALAAEGGTHVRSTLTEPVTALGGARGVSRPEILEEAAAGPMPDKSRTRVTNITKNKCRRFGFTSVVSFFLGLPPPPPRLCYTHPPPLSMQMWGFHWYENVILNPDAIGVKNRGWRYGPTAPDPSSFRRRTQGDTVGAFS